MEPNQKDAGYAGGGPVTLGFVERWPKCMEIRLGQRPREREGLFQ